MRRISWLRVSSCRRVRGGIHIHCSRLSISMSVSMTLLGVNECVAVDGFFWVFGDDVPGVK